MPLLDLWKTNPQTIATLQIDQIVMTAGNGQLADNTTCSTELREYLASIPLSALASYAEHCLSTAFTNSGRDLQDIVNELGRRLDYKITNGRYQGVKGQIGFDGLWSSPEGQTLVVEVKTTDAYAIKLATIANYRSALLSQGLIVEPAFMLIVVGREDTGGTGGSNQRLSICLGHAPY